MADDGKQTINPIAVDINLPKNEFCYVSEKVELYEERTVTKSMSFHGPTLRIKILPGISYRAGNIDLGKRTETVSTKVDTGLLYVTNKRLLFIGSEKSKSIFYKSVLNVDVNYDGLTIIKDSGKNQHFKFRKNVDLTGNIVLHFISET
ncbi:MAG TPA: hypothetical protein DCP32_08930 [Anaerolineaceae bacterium]|nr:hypothetical protein [Anaerolineaceae bacterium]